MGGSLKAPIEYPEYPGLPSIPLCSEKTPWDQWNYPRIGQRELNDLAPPTFNPQGRGIRGGSAVNSEDFLVVLIDQFDIKAQTKQQVSIYLGSWTLTFSSPASRRGPRRPVGLKDGYELLLIILSTAYENRIKRLLFILRLASAIRSI